MDKGTPRYLHGMVQSGMGKPPGSEQCPLQSSELAMPSTCQHWSAAPAPRKTLKNGTEAAKIACRWR